MPDFTPRGVAGVLLCAMAWSLAPVPLGAQARRAAPPATADAPGVSPGELQQLFDAYALMQAQETLQLTDSQYPQFLSRLKALQTVRRRTQAERQRIVQDLRRLVQRGDGNAAVKAAITERIKALRESESRAVTEVMQAADSLDEILDPLQQAKLRILEEQMERRKLELLMRARQGNRGRAGR